MRQDKFDSHEFHDLMQAYRQSGFAVVAAFNAVRKFARFTPQQGEAAGWQDIETAPKAAPLVLHEAGRVFKGGWCEVPFQEFRDEDGFYTGQQDADAFWMDFGSGDQCNPTHWQHEQPLPAAPKEPKP